MASGKKRLAEVMDQDIAQKKKSRKSSSPSRWNQSKFFHTLSESKTFGTFGVQRRHSDGVIAAGSSSKLEEKENVHIVVDEDDEGAETSEPDLDGSDLSLKAQCDQDIDMDLQVDEFPDVVEQEDGYISPTPSCSKDLQDLSSPPRSGQTHTRKWKSNQRLQVDDAAMIQSDEDAYFGVEAVSSPVSTVKQRVSPFVGRGFIQDTPTRRNTDHNDHNDEDDGRILVHATPSPTKIQSPADEIPSPILYYGPDLRDSLALATDGATDLDYESSMDANRQQLRRRRSYPESRYGSTAPPSPSPDTSDSPVLKPRQQIPEHNAKVAVIDVDTADYDLDEEDIEEARARTKMVVNGWRDLWALASKTKKTAQRIPTEEGKTKSISHGSMVLNQCTPGSGSSRIANFKRSNTNVTPRGRHALSSASRYPRSAPSKVPISGIKRMNDKGLGKGRKSMSFVTQTTTGCANREMVDISTADYDSNGHGVVSGQLDDIAMRARERLSMFR